MRKEQMEQEEEQAQTDSPTDLLKEDHQGLSLKLDLLERALLYLRRPAEETSPERVEIEKDLLRELVIALDREIGPHFRKEEEALFPILAEYIGMEHGPIEAMLHEHQKISAAFLRWKKVLPLRRNEPPIAPGVYNALLYPGLQIVTLLRQHFRKENEILFAVSETFLTGEERGEILRRMQTISGRPEKRP